jgi:UDP-glucuronate 4-epimerase
MNALVTGAAGFIGFHLARRLLRDGCRVIGLDNLDDYYDVSLKKARLAEREKEDRAADFVFVHGDLADADCLRRLFADHKPECVVNLAAQAGVRHSIDHPESYIRSNLTGFANILECCRHAGTRHLVYASSSSVYGANFKLPFATHDVADHPVSLYAATKRSNELMAHAYSHLYRFPCTGLRFFTVYGPWGRPDMALFLFTRAILEGRPIRVFNHGRMRRDFTYVDDVIEGVVRAMRRPPAPDPARDATRPDPAASSAPWRIYNIGNNKPVELDAFISALERALGKRALRESLPMQPGDVEATWADVDDLIRDAGFAPHTPVERGIAEFVRWYRDYYKA